MNLFSLHRLAFLLKLCFSGNPLVLLTAAGLLLLASGIPACFFGRTSNTGQRITVLLMALGSAIGLTGWFRAVAAAQPFFWTHAWSLPWGAFSIGVDALSAVFLLPILLIPALGSFYGLGYHPQSRHPQSGRGLGLFYGMLAGAMLFVVLARDSILLLMVWELMAVSAFFLATTDHDDPEVRRSGWIYLVATHTGTLCLMALFVLLHHIQGSFDLVALPTNLPPPLLTTLVALTVIGFGFKAGLMPLHLWLPGAHANAPSHVSAVMSGVMLKMGVYGIVRLLILLPPLPIRDGAVLLALGALSGILGMAFALGQKDLKRLLAYSSIENIGIILMGIGLATLGRSLHRADLIALGLGGALFHVWSHSLFKSLLFMNAGGLIHALHTRNINQMGGLAKRMPRSASLFALGCIAICGLPPLNGFVGEWLMYLGFFRSMDAASGPAWPAAGLAAAALTMIGALALACFVKLYGTVFLGLPRETNQQAPHDPAPTMLIPMALAAAGCLFLGFFPQTVQSLLQQAVLLWTPTGLQPFPLPDSLIWISRLALGLTGVILAACALVFPLMRRRAAPQPMPTWSCGYARPTPRMQYTSTGFAQMLVALFTHLITPRIRLFSIKQPFPKTESFETDVPDTMLDRIVLPFFRLTARAFPTLRLLQQGRIQVYLLYILLMVTGLLCWVDFFK